MEKSEFLGMSWVRWLGNNSRYFTFEKEDRGHQQFRIVEVDAETGNTRNIIYCIAHQSKNIYYLVNFFNIPFCANFLRSHYFYIAALVTWFINFYFITY